MKRHFLDVGANVGQTFIDFLNPRPEYDGWTIWCFEPSPRHLPALMEAAFYQSARYEVHVCPFGMRDNYSILPFFEKDDARGDSFENELASDHATTTIQTQYLLHAVSVGPQDFIEENTSIDDDVVLKLDCEGSEYWILNALIGSNVLYRISTIYVEWHRIGSIPPRTANELSAAFSAAGVPLQPWMH